MSARELGSLLAACVLAAALPLESAAVIVFEDGGTHVVDGLLDDRVGVFDGPGGATTTLLVESTGEITGLLEAFGGSEVEIRGGTIGGDVDANDLAHVAADGASVGGDVGADNGARVDFVAGSLGSPAGPQDAFANDDGRVFLAGPLLVPDDAFVNDRGFLHLDGVEVGDDLFANSEGRIEVVQASVGDDLFTNGSGRIAFGGGSIGGDVFSNGSSRIELSGGALAGTIDAGDTSTIHLLGSGFNVPEGPVAGTSGTLTGTLADGSPLSVPFTRAAGASIVVPEPGREAFGLAAVAALAGLRARRGLP